MTELWQQYGKGLNRDQLQEIHNKEGLGLVETTKVCRSCGSEKPLTDFGKKRNICNLCRAKQQVKRNDVSRPQADRNGQPWTNAEDTYIRENWETTTDMVMARQLKRTLKSVRRRRLFVLSINKNAEPGPKILLDTFERVSNDQIKAITLNIEGSKVTVFCNTNTLWANIWRAFKEEGLTDDDYQAWKVGVTN